jgi:hypothetical protein
MHTDTHVITAQIDRLHAMIENDPVLLDEEFDADLDDLHREFEELRNLLND